MINSATKKHISELFNKEAKHSFFIPKYQREYTWGYNEWCELYDDLMDNEEEYFIGSIIYIPTNEALNPKLEVIDGQQRLTTLSLLITALYTCLKEHKAELDEDDQDEISSLRKSLIAKNSSNGLRIVPQVQNYNLSDYNALMNELGITDKHTKGANFRTRRKIFRCYYYFKYRIEEDLKKCDNISIAEALLSIKSRVLSAMVVAIEVSSHSDAYVMFESLNHRGTPLTAIDLMKNMIMARAERNGLTCDDCFERWQSILQYLPDNYSIQERFFRHYYNAFKNALNIPFRKSEDRKKDPLGAVATKSNLLSIYEKLIYNDLPSFLNDIVLCASLYTELIYPEAEGNASPYSPNLVDLQHVQGVPSYLLLLYLMKKKSELKIDDKMLSRIIDNLVLFFIRRNVTDTPGTRDIPRLLMEIISQIEEQGLKGSTIESHIKGSLKSVSASDELFRQKLEGDIYRENVDAARYILCSLAQKYMTKESWTDLWKRYDKGGTYVWTIEHIFPEGEKIPQEWVDMIADGDYNLAQEYREAYVHKIGNLTMTGYNTELSNYSFEKKRDRKSKKSDLYVGYRNGLGINKDLADKDNWTIDDIKARTTKLVDEVIEMFKI
ncbi:MAG: DUF262 domain-containing HNH endonuclease family protein [Bacteroidales bacterium]|nr:DUF262 domain-containing HNH endonuclease family protein [Bacteroidales bacterium]